MSERLLIYGAYGYTGEIVSRRAVALGLRPILAGRDRAKTEALARELSCDARVFSLGRRDGVRAGIEQASVVVNCAGPFVQTFGPLFEACLGASAHYVDISGEMPVFEMARSLGPRAERAGVMVMPGAGFDVVPTDCMAAHLMHRLPGARSLVLAFQAHGGVSHGTAKTMLGLAGLSAAPSSRHPKERAFDLGEGSVRCVSIPGGDLVSAPCTTGVEDVAVYLAAPKSSAALLRLSSHLAPAFRLPGVGALAASLLARGLPGPEPAARARGRTLVYGEATDALGRKVASRQRQVEAYDFTALSAVEIASRALKGNRKPGWQTPASAYGPDLVLAIEGSTRVEVE